MEEEEEEERKALEAAVRSYEKAAGLLSRLPRMEALALGFICSPARVEPEDTWNVFGKTGKTTTVLTRCPSKPQKAKLSQAPNQKNPSAPKRPNSQALEP